MGERYGEVMSRRCPAHWPLFQYPRVQGKGGDFMSWWEHPEKPPCRHRWSLDKSPASVSYGPRWHESYCLLVRVQKDVDSVFERDLQLDSHAWNELIARDICEGHLGAVSSTFKVQMLSDTKFLLCKVPLNRPGMKWEESHAVIAALQGGFMWCGIPVTLAAWPGSNSQLSSCPGPGADSIV